MCYMYPANWMLLLVKFANYKVLLILNIISELLNPFKYIVTIYLIKVCIDIPKEMIKIIVISNSTN